MNEICVTCRHNRAEHAKDDNPKGSFCWRLDCTCRKWNPLIEPANVPAPAPPSGLSARERALGAYAEASQ